jgi:hypothetical protein
MGGGVVFVTGISGSNVEGYIGKVLQEAQRHEHPARLHDIGKIMHDYARDDDPDVRWEWILDADERARRHLRSLAFQQVAYDVRMDPLSLHLVDLHLCFRWKAYLTRGFEPHLLERFAPYVRCFVNIVEDLPNVQESLRETSWGSRTVLELLIWRDEELFLTDLFADICGRVQAYTIAAGEPPTELEKLLWHPGIKKVYLSFPITNLKDDPLAAREIEGFRDRIREFLVVFDPYASKDYDETYTRQEMAALRSEVGETTEERDYRFIDQADAVVVYFPRRVPSKGVDAEMNHARRTGKPIFLYCPEDPGGGPFAVPPSHFRSNPAEFEQLLRNELIVSDEES